jgi:quercetin dioxygenase-like cupin family protein
VKTIEAWRALATAAPIPDRFSGPVFIHPLNATDDPVDLEILAVYFEAGARTVPHVHSTMQLLYFLEGEGVVGTREGWRLYRKGGTVIIPAGEWHWHGATPSTPTSHLSIRPGGPSAWPPEVPFDDWESTLADLRSDS